MAKQGISRLDERYVQAIRELIQDKFEEDHIRTDFPNRLLREDVLSLLDRYCTAIYFPLEDEENNGFHITGVPDKTGQERHIVYINTAQTIEKQVFTAAHELGHIWKVDQYAVQQVGVLLDDELGERIINRFAAELLIPKDLFEQWFEREYQRLQEENGKIKIRNMLKVIVTLMDQFFAPPKAILYRCWELEKMSDAAFWLLQGEDEVPKAEIDQAIREIIRDSGYIQFQEPTFRKSIEGLAELLNKAELQQCVSVEKIKRLRDLFGLVPPANNEQMDTLLSGE